MDESTTTPDVAAEGVDQTQPTGQTAPTGAENTPSESTAAPATEETTTEAVTDDNLAWLTNKGIDPNSPEALAKVAEMYRNAEKAMHQKSQEAKLSTALENQPDTSTDDFVTDPNAELQAQVQALTLKSNLNDFFAANPEAKEYEAKMAEIVTGNPNIAALVKGQYLGFDQLYAMAVGSDPNRAATLKQEGGREALQSVADKQQAKAVTGAATSSAMATGGPTKENFDAWYAGLTPAQRASEETQKIVASLLS